MPRGKTKTRERRPPRRPRFGTSFSDAWIPRNGVYRRHAQGRGSMRSFASTNNTNVGTIGRAKAHQVLNTTTRGDVTKVALALDFMGFRRPNVFMGSPTRHRKHKHRNHSSFSQSGQTIPCIHAILFKASLLLVIHNGSWMACVERFKLPRRHRVKVRGRTPMSTFLGQFVGSLLGSLFRSNPISNPNRLDAISL